MQINYSMTNILMLLLISGVINQVSQDLQITNVKSNGQLPKDLESHIKNGFENLAKNIDVKNGKAEGKLNVSGNLIKSKKIILVNSGNHLNMFSAFFGEILNMLEDQKNKITIMHLVTGKDPITKELTSKILVQFKGDGNDEFYLGAIEYPFRRETSKSIPRFIQSEDLTDVLTFLRIKSDDLQKDQLLDVNAFERGEVSGEMCGKCTKKVELFSEDEEIKKFQMQLEFLGRRLKDLMKAIKKEKGRDKANAIKELKKVKGEQRTLEEKIFDIELRKNEEKEKEEREREKALRDRFEKEFWDRLKELEKVKNDDLTNGNGEMKKKLNSLELSWKMENDKNQQLKDEYEGLQNKIRDMEQKLNESGDIPHITEYKEKVKAAQNTINDLEKELSDKLNNISQMSAQIDQEKDKEQKLRKREKEMNDRSQQLDDKIQQKNETLENLKLLNKNKLEELTNLENSRNEDKDKKNQLRKSIEDKIKKINKLKNKNKEEDKINDKLQNDLRDKNNIIDDLKKKIQNHRDSHESIENALKRIDQDQIPLQKKLKDMEKKINDMKNKLESEKNLKDQLQKTVTENEEIEKRLLKELNDLKKSQESSVPDSIQDKIENLKESIGLVKDDIKNKNIIVEELNKDIEKLENELENEKKKQNQLRDEIENKNMKVNELQNRLDDKKVDLKEEEDKVKNIEQKEKDLIQVIDEMNTKISTNLGKLKDLQSGVEEKEKEINTLTKEVDDLENDTMPRDKDLKGDTIPEGQGVTNKDLEDESGEDTNPLPDGVRDTELKVRDASKKESLVDQNGNVGNGESYSNNNGFEIQLTDLKEELTFVDLKNFKRNQPELRRQINGLERERLVENKDRMHMDRLIDDYESKWRNTQEVYWKEKELRRKTEQQKQIWERKLWDLQNKLENEINLRRFIEKKGNDKILEINRLKRELTRNDYLIEEAKRECDKLKDQLEYLRKVVYQKQQMEEDLREQNFLIKRKILNFKKKSNDVRLGFPDAWDSDSSTQTTGWKRFKSTTSYDIPRETQSKGTKSSWEVVHKKAYVNGKEVDPNTLSDDYFNNTHDIFDKSIDMKVKRHKSMSTNDNSTVSTDLSDYQNLDLGSLNKNASGVKVKRRVKKAIIKGDDINEFFN